MSERFPEEVWKIKPSGACAGVEDALIDLDELVEETRRQNASSDSLRPINVWGYNLPINNRNALEKYRDIPGVAVGFVLPDEFANPHSGGSFNPYPGDRLMVSAHGAPPEITDIAKHQGLEVFDASCGLVDQVHVLALEAALAGKEIEYAGVAGHAETEGVRGEVSAYDPSKFHLVQSVEEARNSRIPYDREKGIVFLSQTTQQYDIVQAILDATRENHPGIEDLSKSVCYATRHRQGAVKLGIETLRTRELELLGLSTDQIRILVIGDSISHNTKSLVKTSEMLGVKATRVLTLDELTPQMYDTRLLGVTAGASVRADHLARFIDFFKLGGSRIMDVTTAKKEPISLRAVRNVYRARLEELREEVGRRKAA